ncbi:MAG: helix-turn-helix transcriptional regulator [Acidobacteria bacterium]|nr:helix-turn-helix transcriptional regulator [Acidobacteriota bacterium]
MGQITLKIRDVAESKGYSNPFALSQASGINYAICYKLWHSERRRIDLGTLEKLCDTLKVNPGRFFEYERD